MNDTEIALELLKTWHARSSALETLMLGILTLALTGWGVLFAFKQNETQQLTVFRLIFTIVFTVLVTCAYDVVYVMYTQFDISILQLESSLGAITSMADYYDRLS